LLFHSSIVSRSWQFLRHFAAAGAGVRTLSGWIVAKPEVMETVPVKYWDAPSVTSDGSKPGSSDNSVPSTSQLCSPLLLGSLHCQGKLEM